LHAGLAAAAPTEEEQHQQQQQQYQPPLLLLLLPGVLSWLAVRVQHWLLVLQGVERPGGRSLGLLLLLEGGLHG
jgi:hypothetical protein